MFQLKTPTHFRLDQTLGVIQRGEMDPMNDIDKSVWRRCLREENKYALVEVRATTLSIRVKTLTGNLHPTLIRKKITDILGLDDPFLTGSNWLRDFKELAFVQPCALAGFGSLFECIVQTILGQLVSVSAANNIRTRFIKGFGEFVEYKGKRYYAFPEPKSIYRRRTESLKKYGLSTVKAKAVIQAAKTMLDHNWLTTLLSKRTPTDKRLEMITAIHGVGEWTASWVLLRGLRQFDYVPAGDLAIRKAMSWWWEMDELPSIKFCRQRAALLGKYPGLLTYRIMLAYLKKKSFKSLAVG